MATCDKCGAQIGENAKFCPVCGAAKKTAPRAEVGVLPIGTVLHKRYTVEKVLGKGGFGITYKAYDTRENMQVAVKEYYPSGMAHRDTGSTKVSVSDETQDGSFRTGAQRFCDEAKTIAQFNGNANIVSVYEFFPENGTVYYAMEYLDGVDLKHYIRAQGGKLSQESALYIIRSVADALEVTHELGVLHRDISPDNIYILNSGKVKLIDFGAARQMMNLQSQGLSVILKQGFAPFEQYQRKGRQGAWTDIYALGATMYYALTGKIPEDATERLEDPDIGKAQDYGVDEAFWKMIDKCMAVKIENRYQSISEFKNDLARLTFEAKEPEKQQAADHAGTGAEGHISVNTGSGQSSRQPAAVSEQPMVSSQQPAAVSEQQMVSSQQPAAASEQPMISSQQPAAVGEQQMVSGQQPAAVGGQSYEAGGQQAYMPYGYGMQAGGYGYDDRIKKMYMTVGIVIAGITLLILAIVMSVQ